MYAPMAPKTCKLLSNHWHKPGHISSRWCGRVDFLFLSLLLLCIRFRLTSTLVLYNRVSKSPGASVSDPQSLPSFGTLHRRFNPINYGNLAKMARQKYAPLCAVLISSSAVRDWSDIEIANTVSSWSVRQLLYQSTSTAILPST